MNSPFLQIEGTAVVKCTATASVIEIPEGITEIGPQAFQGLTTLEEVKLPRSIKRIGHYAFYGCVNLQSVGWYILYDESNVEYIGDYAFYNCAKLDIVQGIRIFNVIRYIGDYAFYNVGVEAFDASFLGHDSDTVYLGRYAFANSRIRSLNGSSGVGDMMTLQLSEGTFQRCSKLDTVRLAGIDGIPDFCFRACGTDTTTGIGINEFSFTPTDAYNCYAGVSSFQDSMLTSWHESFSRFTDIQAYAFKNVSSGFGLPFDAAQVEISANIVHVGKDAFHGMSFIKLPDDSSEEYTRFVGNSENRYLVMCGGDLQTLDDTGFWPDSSEGFVKVIQDSAFEDSGVAFESINAQYIGARAFKGCEGSNMTFPSKTTGPIQYIGEEAFLDTEMIIDSLGDATQIEYIGNKAFAGCDISSMGPFSLPNIKYIGEEIFGSESSVGDVTLVNTSSDSKVHLSDKAFANSVLNDVLISGPVDLGSGVFEGSTINSMTIPYTIDPPAIKKALSGAISVNVVKITCPYNKRYPIEEELFNIFRFYKEPSNSEIVKESVVKNVIYVSE